MTKFTIGLQAQLVVQTQQNMFALRISDHNPNRGWGNINIQSVIIGLYLRFCASRKLRENISSRVYPVCKTFQPSYIISNLVTNMKSTIRVFNFFYFYFIFLAGGGGL